MTVRKIANIKLQMVITQNPHSKNPEKLWKTVDRIEGEVTEEKKEEVFDPVGFELLKAQLAQNPRFIVKS